MKNAQKLIGNLGTLAIAALALPSSGCLMFDKAPDAAGSSAAHGGAGPGGDDGSGSSSGNPLSTLAPTADALVGRIEKGINGVGMADYSSGALKALNTPIGVSHLAAGTNCLSAYKQVGANLNNNPNPNKANIGAPITQLIFSCCSDVVKGGKLAAFGVTARASDPLTGANQGQVAAAGVKILDQYTAGLASNGPMAKDAAKVFADQLSASPAGTRVEDAFAHVCLAAVAYGATMTGF
jgi:hypothetical protein